VKVDFTVTNITTSDSFLFRQDYSIEFVRGGAPHNQDASSEGNTVLRGRSGNPGYLVGLPLLSAKKTMKDAGNQEAMTALIPGMKVYDASSSPYCNEVGMASSIVNFGEDMITGCILSLTYSNFTDMCQSGIDDDDDDDEMSSFYFTFHFSLFLRTSNAIHVVYMGINIKTFFIFNLCVTVSSISLSLSLRLHARNGHVNE
jgi:hypothetical protein